MNLEVELNKQFKNCFSVKREHNVAMHQLSGNDFSILNNILDNNDIVEMHSYLQCLCFIIIIVIVIIEIQ